MKKSSLKVAFNFMYQCADFLLDFTDPGISLRHALATSPGHVLNEPNEDADTFHRFYSISIAEDALEKSSVLTSTRYLRRVWQGKLTMSCALK